MNIVSEVIKLTGDYLKGIGVDSSVVDSELKDIRQALVLKLPKVCIIKENRNGEGGNQTHIHITGSGMSFFFDKELLENNPGQFANDVKENIVLFSKNLIDLQRMAKDEHGLTRNFNVDNNSELIKSFTYKKVGRIGTHSIQVQISKKNLDDISFLNLRKCLFRDDFLIFLKADDGKKIIVIGMSNSNFRPKGFSRNTIFQQVEEKDNDKIESKVMETQEVYHESNLREVNFSNIATYTASDEDDTSVNNPVDYSTGIAIRKKRTERHQDIVKLIALDLEREGYKLFENPVDCLAIRGEEKALLFEIKTLDGTSSDEKKQVQKSFAQLFYYEEFYAKKNTKNEIQKIVVFENKINDNHISFFEHLGIEVFWISETKHLVNKNGVVKF